LEIEKHALHGMERSDEILKFFDFDWRLKRYSATAVLEELGFERIGV
jgi:hypothetical protein